MVIDFLAEEIRRSFIFNAIAHGGLLIKRVGQHFIKRLSLHINHLVFLIELKRQSANFAVFCVD